MATNTTTTTSLLKPVRTYSLGSLDDREVMVTEHDVKIYSKVDPKKYVVLDMNRLGRSQSVFY